MTLIKKISPHIALFILALSLNAIFVNHLAAETVQQKLLKVADKKASGNYVRKQFVSLLNKPFDLSDQANPAKKILIIGDSHAQDFVNMVFENGKLKNYQLSTRHIPTRCQPILAANMSAFIAAKDQNFCAKSDSLGKAKTQISQADIIILVANWTLKSAKQLPTTIKNLHLNSSQKLFVLGRKSFGKVTIRRYLRLPEKELRNLRNPVDAKQQAINTLMKSSLDKNIFIDMQELICSTSNSCRVFSSDLQLISFDGGHLTPAGAAYLGSQLFQKSLLKNL